MSILKLRDMKRLIFGLFVVRVIAIVLAINSFLYLVAIVTTGELTDVLYALLFITSFLVGFAGGIIIADKSIDYWR